MDYVSIGKENMADFESVLYPGFASGERRVTIGACDEDGTVLGAVCLSF